MRFDPRVAEGDVGSLGDHVVAPVARRILEEARAPIAVRQVPPILLGTAAAVEVEMNAVPIGRAAFVLDAIVE